MSEFSMPPSMPPYDDGNVFARILRGEIPAVRLYEDEATLAFLDAAPQIRGHALIVPKSRATGFLDIDEASLSAVMRTGRRLAVPLVRAMGAEGFILRQFNGSAAGQTVFHFHLHILPLCEGDRLRGHGEVFADREELEACAKLIRREIARDEGHDDR